MKAQKIYNIALAIMDEYLTNGQMDTTSTKDYAGRTPDILTMLDAQVYMEIVKVNDSISLPDTVTSMNTDIDFEDEICAGILPVGLAAYLLMQENRDIAIQLLSLFQNKLASVSGQYRAKGTIIARDDEYYSLNETNDC